MSIKKLWIIVALCGTLISCGSPAPEVKGTESGHIDVSQQPEQERISDGQIIKKNVDGETFNIQPLADYRISALVVSAESYSKGPEGALSPVDLALAWGDLAISPDLEMIEFSQSGRWYHYRWPAGFSHSPEFISHNSANTHMIPANENLWRALLTVKKGDVILAEGYLVKITANYKGRRWRWQSSLTRKDTAGRSCEVFYVKRLRVNDKRY